MSHTDKHLGADAVARAEMPRPRVEMNLTPLIDVLLVLIATPSPWISSRPN